MIVYPKAKINLGLRVVSRRSDGYHNLETLFVDLWDFRDILEINPSDKLSLTLYGEELKGEWEENLVIKAYRLLEREFSLPPVKIDLYKKIPSGAGLGGGSSDCAATLLLLNRMFHLNLSIEQLMVYGAKLGSDCPYFIYANSDKSSRGRENHLPALSVGRGESVVPFELPLLDQLEIRVVTQPLSISTAEAFSSIVAKTPKYPIEEILKGEISHWREHLINDFEEPLFDRYPHLREVKEQLYREGALYASLTGSGPTLFGLFQR